MYFTVSRQNVIYLVVNSYTNGWSLQFLGKNVVYLVVNLNTNEEDKTFHIAPGKSELCLVYRLSNRL